MDEEELLPRRPTPKPRDLTSMAITELEAYIQSLEEEIARARQEIQAKHKHRGGAEGLFKR